MSVTLASSRLCALILRGFTFAGLLWLASCARHVASLQAIDQKATTFDYFLLVRQWPGSYCSKQSCTLHRNRGYHFTIHGLWPNYEDGTWPQFCDSSYKFDEDKLEDLMDELESEWPSTMSSDESFWEHEWSKHGTCSTSVFPTEHSYFSSVLKLHRRYDLAAALRKADIVPDKHKVYRAKDLVDAIHGEYGVRPVVHCYDGNLSEIWMCFDKHLRPFSCDEAHESNSCQEFTIPPLSPEGAQGSETEVAGDARQKQLQKQKGTVKGGGGGGGQLAATDAAAEVGRAPEAVATGNALGAPAAAAGNDGEALDGAMGSGDTAEVGLDDRMPYKGTVVEDSIYWLLEPDAVALLAAASADAAATAAASAGGGGSGLSTLPGVDPTLKDKDSEPAAAEATAAADAIAGEDDSSSSPNGRQVPFADLHDDAGISTIRPEFQSVLGSAQQQQQQQHLMEIQLIEQRLMQQGNDNDNEEQLAVAALTAVDAPGGAGALAVLAALAERTLLRLQQQLQVGGGGELLNDGHAAGGELPFALQPKAGSASSSSSVAALGAQDFVWTSKLRSGADEMAFSADEATERASLGDGGGSAAAMTVVTSDGATGPALWTVQHVLVVPADGVGARVAPMWVVLLLAVQLICVVAIVLVLVVVTGMAIVGARLGPREQRHLEPGCGCEEEAPDEERGRWQQEQRQQPQCWAAAGASRCCGGDSRDGAEELAEPLLLQLSDEDEDEGDDGEGAGAGATVDMAASPPKICHANRDTSATEEEEEEEKEEEERQLARQRQQHQQQQGWHVSSLRGDLGPGPVFVLPVVAAAAAARSSPAAHQPTAPVH